MRGQVNISKTYDGVLGLLAGAGTFAQDLVVASFMNCTLAHCEKRKKKRSVESTFLLRAATFFRQIFFLSFSGMNFDWQVSDIDF